MTTTMATVDHLPVNPTITTTIIATVDLPRMTTITNGALLRTKSDLRRQHSQHRVHRRLISARLGM